MKKSFLFCLFVISVLLLTGCSNGKKWAVEEKLVDGLYMYKITSAPKKYEKYEGSLVHSYSGNHNAIWGWPVSHKDEIDNYLKKKDLIPEVNKFGEVSLFLPKGFFVSQISQEQLGFIWDTLSQWYAGFSEMTKKGFSQKKLFAVKTSTDLDRLFDKYVQDCHFSVRIRDYMYDQPTARDEGTTASKDPNGTYLEKETSNAYYIRFNNASTEAYNLNFPGAALAASKKDFIVLDARSNCGGDFTPVESFKKALTGMDYKGTIFCLQDNWSYSAGEIWHVFGSDDTKLNCKLVGTHSGGVLKYSSSPFENKALDIFVTAGIYASADYTLNRWLGEGKGYEPEIWATKENMKEVLQSQGVNLDGIEFN